MEQSRAARLHASTAHEAARTAVPDMLMHECLSVPWPLHAATTQWLAAPPPLTADLTGPSAMPPTLAACMASALYRRPTLACAHAAEDR
jgi:hypothetical protein